MDIRRNPDLELNKDTPILAYVIGINVRREDYLIAGANEVLYKPCKIKKVLKAIDQLIPQK